MSKIDGQIKLMPQPGFASDSGICVEILPDFRLLAAEPHTGAEVPLGYDKLGEWIEVAICRGKSISHGFRESEFRLRYDLSMSSFDCSLDLALLSTLIRQTKERCYHFARKTAMGMLPLLRHSVEVKPVLGGIPRVGVGRNIPSTITHLRRCGTATWVPVSDFSFLELGHQRSEPQRDG